MTAATATIHIVDDDEAFRDSVQWLLESVGMNAVVHESAAGFLTTVNADTVGCLVTDVRMPGMSGLELQRTMRARKIDLPVIVMTAHGDVDTAVQAMKDGAIDFIEKPFKDQPFLDKVNGAVAVCADRHATHQLRADLEQRLTSLSARENEVLNLIIAGSTNKATARKLGLAEKTVEAHRANIMQKIRANSLADLVKIVVSARD